MKDMSELVSMNFFGLSAEQRGRFNVYNNIKSCGLLSKDDISDYGDLLDEFEKMLGEEDVVFPQFEEQLDQEIASRKGYAHSGDLPDISIFDCVKKKCRHKWKCTYISIINNKQYFNCKYCDIKKEDWEENEINQRNKTTQTDSFQEIDFGLY